ncbi:uncharacterized protein [Amphiura filiformis]|uniref:uncharacterized protein n=1 Tax=Amphiura filiformis TaxID=82378 RepID=UPI003B20BE97
MKPSGSETTTLSFTTQSDTPVTVSVQIPGISYQTTLLVSPSLTTELELPSIVYPEDSSLKHTKTVTIIASSEVSIHGIVAQDSQQPGGFNLLPSSSLDLSYYIVTYEPTNDIPSKSAFSISALNQRTLVKYTTEAGAIETIDLDPYESYLHVSDGDLTGTFISADQPVSVLSFQVNTATTGYLVEQLLPTCSWSTGTFILAPFQGTSGYRVRIIASTSDTCVTVSDGSTLTLSNAGDYLERHVDSNPDMLLTITADQPIMVLQFPEGISGEPLSDMLLIPAVSHYPRHDITVPVTNDPSSDQYFIILSRCIDLVSMTYDGNIAVENGWNVIASENGVLCASQSPSLSAVVTEHTIGSNHPQAEFLVIFHAYRSNRGYGYIAGMDTQQISCGKVDFFIPMKSVTFNPNEWIKTIPIEAYKDSVIEGKECFTVSFCIKDDAFITSNTVTVSPSTTSVCIKDVSSMFWIEEAQYTATEGNNLIIRVHRGSNLDRTDTLAVTYKSLGALQPTDFNPQGDALLTFAKGSNMEFKVVTIQSDKVLEYLDNFLVSIRVSDDSTRCGRVVSPWKSEITIRDPTWYVLQYSEDAVIESGHHVAIKILRRGELSANGFVHIKSEELTASQDADFTLLNEQVLFASYESEQTVTLEILNDTLVERDEVLKVFLHNPEIGEAVSDMSMTIVTILDDDDIQASSYNFAKVLYFLASTESSVALQIIRSGDQVTPGRVELSIQALTTSAISDFVSLENSVIDFQPGVGFQDVVVRLEDGVQIEEEHYFEVCLQSSVSGDIGVSRCAVVIVQPRQIDEDVTVSCPDGHCLNGGTCESIPGNILYACRCSPEFVGNKCQNEVPSPTALTPESLSPGALSGIIIGSLVLITALMVALMSCCLFLRRLRATTAPNPNPFNHVGGMGLSEPLPGYRGGDAPSATSLVTPNFYSLQNRASGQGDISYGFPY